MITENQLKRALKLQARIKDVQSDIRKIEDMAMTVANQPIRTEAVFYMEDVEAQKKPKKDPAPTMFEEIFKNIEQKEGKTIFKIPIGDIYEETESDQITWTLAFQGTEFLLVLQAMLTYKKKRLEQWTKELSKIIQA